MKTIILHDDDCPRGTNGLRAYSEAREAMSSCAAVPELTGEDRADLAAAEWELERKQVCTCGKDRQK
jgi:hypothetical protein